AEVEVALATQRQTTRGTHCLDATILVAVDVEAFAEARLVRGDVCLAELADVAGAGSRRVVEVAVLLHASRRTAGRLLDRLDDGVAQVDLGVALGGVEPQ